MADGAGLGGIFYLALPIVMGGGGGAANGAAPIAADGADVSGILHLAALAVVLTAGYIGIDRIGRDEARKFRRNLLDVGNKVRAQLLQFDLLSKDTAEITTVWDIDALHILCHIASVRVLLVRDGARKPPGFFRKARCFYQCQRHVPALSYFRNRFDRKLLVLIGALVTIDLFLLVAATVWNLPWTADRRFTEWSFWLCSGAILIVFLTAACAYPLFRIDAVAKKLMDRVGARAQEVMDAKMTEGLRALAQQQHTAGAEARPVGDDD